MQYSIELPEDISQVHDEAAPAPSSPAKTASKFILKDGGCTSKKLVVIISMQLMGFLHLWPKSHD